VRTPAKTGRARTGIERKRGPSVTNYLLDDKSMADRIEIDIATPQSAFFRHETTLRANLG
jgi:hypothetical protein